MPNTFAYITLIIWPFVSLIFYKKMPVVNATFWTIVGGFLLLPVSVAIDFPLLPPLNKESIPVLSALIGCIFIKKIKLKLLPKTGVERWLVFILLVSPFITTFNNQEVYNFIPGLTLHDTFSSVLNIYIYILPFIIGMQLIKTYEDQLMLFKLLVIACLFYSVLILYEVRMSPQLHTSIYGFFPHSFGQQRRFGGFRAVVFLGHGLLVAMFVAISLGAVTILLKEKVKSYGFTPWFIVIYFFILLLLCKTVGSFILGSLLFFTIKLMSAEMIKRLSLFLLLIFLMYPFLSMLDYFPHDTLVQLATDFDPGRGESLGFRFHHENLLLEHAKQKLFFGWGGWGRNRLDGSVTDGYWIIILGVYGLIGFMSLYGLLALSVWKAAKTSSTLLKDKKEQKLLIYHTLVVVVVMIDQIPNASLSAWLMLLAGALLGRSNNEYMLHHNKSRIV